MTLKKFSSLPWVGSVHHHTPRRFLSVFFVLPSWRVLRNHRPRALVSRAAPSESLRPFCHRELCEVGEVLKHDTTIILGYGFLASGTLMLTSLCQPRNKLYYTPSFASFPSVCTYIHTHIHVCWSGFLHTCTQFRWLLFHSTLGRFGCLVLWPPALPF